MEQQNRVKSLLDRVRQHLPQSRESKRQEQFDAAVNGFLGLRTGDKVSGFGNLVFNTYESYRRDITHLAKRLSSENLTDFYLSLVNMSNRPSLHGARDKEGKVYELLENLLGNEVTKSPKFRETVIKQITSDDNQTVCPDQYQFLAKVAAKAYDSDMFDVFSSRLREIGTGPWTAYKADPLIDIIISKTFDSSTPANLRKRGADFLLEELNVVDEKHPFGTPRNVMYIDRVAKAVREHTDDANVSGRYAEYAEAISLYAYRLLEVAQFNTQLNHTDRHPKYSPGFFDKWSAEGTKAVRPIFGGVTEDEIRGVPIAGASYDRTPAIAYECRQRLLDVLRLRFSAQT